MGPWRRRVDGRPLGRPRGREAREHSSPGSGPSCAGQATDPFAEAEPIVSLPASRSRRPQAGVGSQTVQNASRVRRPSRPVAESKIGPALGQLAMPLVRRGATIGAQRRTRLRFLVRRWPSATAESADAGAAVLASSSQWRRAGSRTAPAGGILRSAHGAFVQVDRSAIRSGDRRRGIAERRARSIAIVVRVGEADLGATRQSGWRLRHRGTAFIWNRTPVGGGLGLSVADPGATPTTMGRSADTPCVFTDLPRSDASNMLATRMIETSHRPARALPSRAAGVRR